MKRDEKLLAEIEVDLLEHWVRRAERLSHGPHRGVEIGWIGREHLVDGRRGRAGRGGCELSGEGCRGLRLAEQALRGGIVRSGVDDAEEQQEADGGREAAGKGGLQFEQVEQANEPGQGGFLFRGLDPREDIV